MDVIYDRGTFLGYWFFGFQRYLSIVPHNGEETIVWTASAKNGVAEK